MDFNNPSHREEKLRQIKERCTEVPPLPGKNVTGKCWVPIHKMDEDFTVINSYTSGKLSGMSRGLHVLTLSLANGTLREHSEDGLEVGHLCDRKPCCNPAHLELVTRKKNNDDAIERGLSDPHALIGIQKPFQRGEKNVRAKATDRQIAEIKWLIQNAKNWFTSELSARYGLIEVLAIFYQLTVPSLKVTQRRENWRHIRPIQPDEMPTAERIPVDAKPPEPKKDGPIGPEKASQILQNYSHAEDKARFVKVWADKLGVAPLSVQNVLSGKTWKEIEPQIPRAKNFASHRLITVSDREVQQIRATWAANSDLPGLKAALHRKFGCEPYYIGHIIERVVRMSVPDDPTAVIPLAELEFSPTAQRGAKHKLSKLKREDVTEVIRRLNAGESVVKVAQALGVSTTVIYGIRNGTRYTNEQENIEGGR